MVAEKKKKAENWSWRQNSGRLSHDSTSSEDNDFEAAVAAATFAVASFNEAEVEASPTETKSIGYAPSLPESGEDATKKPELIYSMPPENTVTNQNVREAVKGTTRVQMKADSWEKSAMAKIRKRYEKQYSMILSWENEKKAKARWRLDKIEQRRVGLIKEIAKQAYESEAANIDMNARASRAIADEEKQNAEFKIKEKANRIRLKRRVPVTCFCF